MHIIRKHPDWFHEKAPAKTGAKFALVGDVCLTREHTHPTMAGHS